MALDSQTLEHATERRERLVLIFAREKFERKLAADKRRQTRILKSDQKNLP